MIYRNAPWCWALAHHVPAKRKKPEYWRLAPYYTNRWPHLYPYDIRSYENLVLEYGDRVAARMFADEHAKRTCLNI